MIREINDVDFSREFHFRTSRSSGPGGQNVNKVNTRVELFFDVENSSLLSDEEKERIKLNLASRLTNDFVLIISAQSERTQLKNKSECIRKFYDLIESAFAETKKRRPIRMKKSAIETRLKQKKLQADKKTRRKKPNELI